MAISRYRGTEIVLNDLEEHQEFFEVRGTKFIMQHRTRSLKKISPADHAALHQQMHLWKQADRFWKLAAGYYGDVKYWWVIAEYNQKPTEAHISNGDVIVIPMPLQEALRALGH
jgi:hypothetical protein